MSTGKSYLFDPSKLPLFLFLELAELDEWETLAELRVSLSSTLTEESLLTW